jgi:endo-1,4-beta-mannosidase
MGKGRRTAVIGVVLIVSFLAAVVVATVGVQRRGVGGCDAPPARLTAVNLAPGDFVQASETSLVLAGKPFHVHGANYYPSHLPWDHFWPEYDQKVIDGDFSRFAAWGLNTVRVFIRFDQFGGGEVSPAALDKLADLLSRASNHGLLVIPTLFDFHSEYLPSSWPRDDRQLRALVLRFRDDPTILAWDIKNELDLDYPRHGKATVNAWLVHEVALARQYDGRHLITVGWATADHALASPVAVDVVSFHLYEPVSRLTSAYAELRRQVSNRPLLLEEFGSTTWSATRASADMEREQARYYSGVLDFLARSDAAGFAMWTPYDLENIPPDVGSPSRTAIEAQYGVIRLDGSAKPALKVLMTALRRPPHLPGDRFSCPPTLAF